ncbi:MAG: HD domain-containing phosphohydrolase [Pseudomonadota bacterium]|nr:PAS domain S-box protein [Patescibacteria group bacterium]
MMKADQPLRILFVEDLPTDAELAERELRKAGISFTSMRVETKEAFLKALEDFRPDLIVSDYAMPEFDGMQALKLSLEYDPNLPFIIFTGSMNEETAVACMKAGATDYVIKERMKRLPMAVAGGLEQKKVRLMKNEAERALRESEERYRNLFDNANEAIFVAQEGKLVFLNPMSAIMTGYSGEELMAKPFIEFIHPDDREMVIDRHIERMKAEEIIDRYSFQIIHRDGNIRWVELNSVMISWKGKPATLNFLSDITERKQMEVEVRKRMKELWALYGLAELVQREDITLHELYKEFTNILPKSWQYEEIACARMVIGDSEFRTENFAETQWMQSAPIMVNSEVVGRIEVGYLEERPEGSEGPFLEEERFLIDAIAKQLGQITERKEAEQKLKDTIESLRKAVGATIQVMVSAVETRDPYTSGHQVRAADLARAIAIEMGLPQDKIDAIRMAGSIHDIGKLSIPAEILSKPTQLSDIEFALIKEHARKGYEMLKDVESPWPLAEIVRQHHERMDGSGYPRNLKGDDILIEARILAVADVVEAMASHRPYRPGLGIDAALNEIEKNKSLFYDEAAADACLRLFREKDFKLEGIAYDR